MVRTREDAIKALKELVSSWDTVRDQEHTLVHSFEMWIEIRKQKRFSSMTTKALELAKSNEYGYIGKYNGVKCYILKPW